VALTDATVTDLGGGWYKVENDITFDHTLNLLADTYLTIAEGKTMTVNTASGKAIDSEYTLNVSGAGALNITTAGAYTIAVRVGSYVQTGATVTASGYIGIRCIDNFKGFNVTNDFTFSGGQLTATGSASDGIWADNDISLSCTNATDFIYASSYSSIYGAVKIAEGKALTDGINTYENTISSSTLKALTNVKLQPVTKTINFDSKGGSEVDAQTIVFGSVANEPDAPTRDGYTFDGWYLTGSQYDFSTAVTDDITLMAVWKKVNGALTLTEYGDRTTATINGNYTADDALLTLAEEIAVTSVTFDRTFTPGATSTIILPFTVESGNYEGGTFYEFTSVDYKNDKWVASLTKVAGNIEAHKPYLYMPSDDKLTIKSGVKFTATSAEEYTDTKGDWTFKGVFKKKDWETGVRTDYFFASTSATSTEGNAVNAGDFVRIGNKCHLSPFRCYLSYSVSGSEQSLLKSAKELPLSIEVRLIDEVASVVEPDDNPSESGEVITPVSEITPNSGIKVWSFDGTIFIEAQPNMDYTIVDLNGRTLKNGVTNSTREEVTLNRAAGIVIVKIGNKTFKVQY